MRLTTAIINKLYKYGITGYTVGFKSNFNPDKGDVIIYIGKDGNPGDGKVFYYRGEFHTFNYMTSIAARNKDMRKLEGIINSRSMRPTYDITMYDLFILTLLSHYQKRTNKSVECMLKIESIIDGHLCIRSYDNGCSHMCKVTGYNNEPLLYTVALLLPDKRLICKLSEFKSVKSITGTMGILKRFMIRNF